MPIDTGELTDEELAQQEADSTWAELSTFRPFWGNPFITDAEILAAYYLWRNNVPAMYYDMLWSLEAPPPGDTNPHFFWVFYSRSQMYRRQDGVILGVGQTKQILEFVIQAILPKLKEIATHYADNNNATHQQGQSFLSAFEKVLKPALVVAAALAVGGFQRLKATSGTVVRQTEDLIRQQLAYAAGFAADMTHGAKLGMAAVRAGLYAQAVRVVYQQARRVVATFYGRTEEKRILTYGEHCVDCIGAAALDWQPIGTLPAIGDSVCRVHCHCYFIYQ